ncbi:hypothetical protein ASPZODRAFT_55298 [Penicilliopsis zonata CBS 506.65]|uniref:2'-phosphotransferase n=1 Tax=Penicilliopsis zonata CBS 506.65 TaxID=1073090 RepID=A0A1L9SW37_9EURO|nr:hypothetical protein ASPZODRAFT_55298 [Penicilliopsis zonata CBS 506.65]OJJ51321.1 hypothetical protein ASPZODRAFT_55298 [Penicilliopsis zonata CBS 506.65]
MPPRTRNGKRREDNREVSISKALSKLLRHSAEEEGLKLDTRGYANVTEVMKCQRLKSLQVTFPEILTAVSSSDKKRFALLHIPSTPVESPAAAAVIDEEETERETATQNALSAQDPDPSHFLIRATQGHSIKSVDAAAFLERLSLADEARLPTTVVHGTYHATWVAIMQSGGLRCMGRNHVHFAVGPSLQSVLASISSTPQEEEEGGEEETPTEPQVISGMRRDAPVLVYINLKKALAAGCPFWRSENDVILSEGMPASNAETGKHESQQRKFVPLEFVDVVVERRKGLGILWEKGREVQQLPESLTSRPPPKNKHRGH